MKPDNHLAPPMAGSAPGAYRQYAREWLQINLPHHMRADSLLADPCSTPMKCLRTG